eukprot:Opistho-1_new@77617
MHAHANLQSSCKPPRTAGKQQRSQQHSIRWLVVVSHRWVEMDGRARRLKTLLLKSLEYVCVAALVKAHELAELLEVRAGHVVLLHVHAVHIDNVVAEVENLKAAVLTEEVYQRAPGPLQALAKQVLGAVFGGVAGRAEDKLDGAPQPLKLLALLDFHHAVRGHNSAPVGSLVVQNAHHLREHSIEEELVAHHGAAQRLGLDRRLHRRALPAARRRRHVGDRQRLALDVRQRLRDLELFTSAAALLLEGRVLHDGEALVVRHRVLEQFCEDEEVSDLSEALEHLRLELAIRDDRLERKLEEADGTDRAVVESGQLDRRRKTLHQRVHVRAERVHERHLEVLDELLEGKRNAPVAEKAHERGHVRRPEKARAEFGDAREHVVQVLRAVPEVRRGARRVLTSDFG